MSNLQVPDDVPIDHRIMEKLVPNLAYDNLQKYFKYYRGESEPMAQCRICDEIITRPNWNTSNMKNHLKRDHQISL